MVRPSRSGTASLPWRASPRPRSAPPEGSRRARPPSALRERSRCRHRGHGPDWSCLDHREGCCPGRPGQLATSSPPPPWRWTGFHLTRRGSLVTENDLYHWVKAIRIGSPKKAPSQRRTACTECRTQRGWPTSVLLGTARPDSIRLQPGRSASSTPPHREEVASSCLPLTPLSRFCRGIPGSS
jgi:hypothetical protein